MEGTGFEFIDAIKGGRIPREYIPAVKKGIEEAVLNGVLGGYPVIDIEVDMFSQGNARDSVMVGMPDVAVRESRERIKSALINSGFGYPNKRITINLAPRTSARRVPGSTCR